MCDRLRSLVDTKLKVKYVVLIGLVFCLFLAELVVGIIADSITLQTDAFHMLSDLLALCIGLTAQLLLKRKKNHRYTYGWLRSEILAGFINSVFLLSIAFMLVIENIKKYIELADDPSNDKLEKDINLVLIVAGGGLAVNIIGIVLFHNEHSHGHSHGGTNADDDDQDTQVINYAQYAVLLHIISDTLGSILVIISGLIIKYVKANWKFFLDPTGSMIIIILITFISANLLRKCIQILMHKWSGHAIGPIQTDILALENIETVHDFHVWSLTSEISIASLHIKLTPETDGAIVEKIILDVKAILHRYGIHSSSIQPEWATQCIEPDCHNSCVALKCCETV